MILRATARTAIAGALMALAIAVAQARTVGGFIDGTYATKEGCAKLAKLAAGKPRNVETVPETLTKDGFQSWEGSCEFTQVLEHEPGKVYIGIMYCVDAGSFYPETDLFIRESDGTISVAVQGNDSEPTVLQRCGK